MTREELKGYVEAALGDGNYLSAYMMLRKEKDNVSSEDDVIDFTGKIVEQIIDELSRLPRRENRERIMYLRSLLTWIFKDVPGLSGVYREQLRMMAGQNQGMADLFKALNIRGIANITGNEDAVIDDVEDTVDTIKQNIEDAADKVRNGEMGDSMRDFLTFAEKGVRQGLRQINDVLNSLGNKESDKDQDKDR